MDNYRQVQKLLLLRKELVKDKHWNGLDVVQEDEFLNIKWCVLCRETWQKAFQGEMIVKTVSNDPGKIVG